MNRDKSRDENREGGHYFRRHDVKAEHKAQVLQRQAAEILEGLDCDTLEEVPQAVFVKLMLAQAIAPTKYGNMAFASAKVLAEMAGMGSKAGTQSEMAARFEAILKEVQKGRRPTTRKPKPHRPPADVPAGWPPDETRTPPSDG